MLIAHPSLGKAAALKLTLFLCISVPRPPLIAHRQRLVLALPNSFLAPPNLISNLDPPDTASSMIPKVLLLVKQIRPGTPQIDNLRTPIPILLQPRTLEAVESVRNALFQEHHRRRHQPPYKHAHSNQEGVKLTSPPHTTHLFW